MTLIVSTGDLLLVDRCTSLTSTTFGAKAGEGYTAYLNNVCKIQRFSSGFIQVKEHRVVALAQAGRVDEIQELWRLLEDGVPYMSIVKYELQLGVRLFKDNATIMITDDGLTLESEFVKGEHILTAHANGELVLVGIAANYVRVIGGLSHRTLTPLDCMVLGSRQYRSVSENFDMYSRATNKLTIDVSLSERQTLSVLAKVNQSLEINTKPWNHHYSNSEV